MSRYYVTTPIYYVNDAPHIGHAYTTVAADALARWHRLLGDETFFLTGTDEHGLKIQRAAEAHGLTPLEQADITSERFRATWAQLNISNDDFIRTTEARHYRAVQALLQRCYDNGHIYKSTYSGLYCVACEAYYTDSDLVDGMCPIHGTPVERLEEDNYFFRLSSFTDRLLEWYENDPDCIQPDGKRREAIGIVKQGLDDVSITRTSLQWGVPVPWDEGHVFYVWYDALINYATAVGYASDDERFARWWPATTHLLAKDILRFHGVYWPAMLMAAGIEPLPRLRVHGYLLVGGEKMSKTRLNQIAPGELIETFGVDGVRYHFLRDTPFGPDGDFSYEGMIARYNSDLANQLGNLLQRVSTVVQKKCGGIGPASHPGSPLAAVVDEIYRDVADAWRDTQPSVALEATWRIIRATNDYLQSNEPWKMEPGPACDAVMGNSLDALRIVTVLASPAMPDACEAIWRRIGMTGSVLDQRLPDAARWGGYPGSLPVADADPLFPRLRG